MSTLMTDLLTDYTCGWIVGWNDEWITGWLTTTLGNWMDWLLVWLVRWLFGNVAHFPGWLINLRDEWLADPSSDWSTEWQANWLKGRVILWRLTLVIWHMADGWNILGWSRSASPFLPPQPQWKYPHCFGNETFFNTPLQNMHAQILSKAMHHLIINPLSGQY